MIAAITIVISGLLAFVQNDIKKVLAYSTVGQLGYMMLGLGAGAWLPAVFHIFTHAFFKCCLFLCAGSVSHSGSHHSFDMKKDMGGLAKKMPITATCWIICSLALAGVFPLAGFFSKDEIIDNVGHNGYTVFMWSRLVGAFLTAAYTVRATYLTFFGEPRGAAASGGDEAHGAELAAAISSHDIAHDIQQEGELEADAATARPAPSPSRSRSTTTTTAHGAHDDHGHGAHQPPHESPKLILVPIVHPRRSAPSSPASPTPRRSASSGRTSRSTSSRAPTRSLEDGAAAGDEDAAAGILRSPPTRAARARRPRPPRARRRTPPAAATTAPAEGTACYFPTISHAEFKWAKAALSLIIVGVGLLVSWFVCVALYTQARPPPRRAHRASRPARAGYTFLANKYYLDALYENVIVRAIAHPIASAANWVNQNVIDGDRQRRRASARKAGRHCVYRNIDQRVVDGAVNGSGAVANEHRLGAATRPVRQGQPVRRAALRGRSRRRPRARDRQRVRELTKPWTSSPIRTGC